MIPIPGAPVSWPINTLNGDFRKEMDRAVSIERTKSQCNLVWLENLNLHGDYKKRILDWIRKPLDYGIITIRKPQPKETAGVCGEAYEDIRKK